ncbi:MAG TPA: caspase family protein [Bradyrhizobium sp.]|jgi:hypothetical protein|nr:caspase family protein [Bradyrhizobium sp.]
MLVVDRRAQVGDDVPGLHALIVGVSDYPNLPVPGDPAGNPRFGFYKVQGPAASAAALARWLEAAGNNYKLMRKLKTVRLLLAPSAAEAVASWPGQAWGSPDVDTVVQAVEQWRNDCNSCGGDNIALLYFSGHGINVSSDDVLLAMMDIGHPNDTAYSLQRFIRVQSIFQAMAPSDLYMNMAKTQFYFIDACRTDNQDAISYGGRSDRVIGGNAVNTTENRAAPIFFAAEGGDPAFAPSPAGTKYGTALLSSLNNSSADLKLDNQGAPLYTIGTFSLRTAVNNAIGRTLPVRGYSEDVDLVVRLLAPLIDVQVEIIPPNRGTTIQLDGRNVDTNVPIQSIAPVGGAPHIFQTAAGRYSFEATWMPAGPCCFRHPGRSLIGPVEYLKVDART